MALPGGWSAEENGWLAKPGLSSDPVASDFPTASLRTMISSLIIAALMFLPGSARPSAEVLRPTVTLPQEELAEHSAEASPATPSLPWRKSPQAFATWVGPSLVVPSQYDYACITW